MKPAELQKVKASRLAVKDSVVMGPCPFLECAPVTKITSARETHVKGEKQTPGMLMTIHVILDGNPKRFRVLPSADLYIQARNPVVYDRKSKTLKVTRTRSRA